MTLPINAPLAMQAYIGMELDPIRLGYPRQVITDLKHITDDEHDWITNVWVKTDQGEWTFGRDEHMAFPRRMEGSPDWRKNPIAPTPYQLCIKDVLHPAIYEPDNLPRERITTWRQLNAQIVTGIWLSGGPTHCVIKTFTIFTRQLRQWHFSVNEHVMFPRPVNIPERRIDRSLGSYGPYELKDDTSITVSFYVHPTGRGRWGPEYASFFIPSRPGHYEMRPPKLRGDWGQFRLTERGTTHPNDPVFWRKGKLGESATPELWQDN